MPIYFKRGESKQNQKRPKLPWRRNLTRRGLKPTELEIIRVLKDSNHSNNYSEEERLVRKAINSGHEDEAVYLIERLNPLAPDFGRISSRSAAHLVDIGQHAHASRALSCALAAQNESADYFIRLARLANVLDRRDLERKALVRAFDLEPIAEKLRIRLVDLCLDRGEVSAATRIAEQASQQPPHSDAAFLKWIACLEISGHYNSAEENIRQRIASAGSSDALFLAWGRIVIDQFQQPKKFLAEFHLLVGERKETWVTNLLLGKAYAGINDDAEALLRFDRAVDAAPTQAKAWFELGLFQRRIGMTEASQKSFRHSLALEPHNVTALRHLGLEHRHRYGDANFENVNVALANAHQYSQSSQIEIHYAAAKAFDDVGESATAFAHYARAGRLHRRVVPWNDTRLRKIVKSLQTHATPSWRESARLEGFASDKPVFIVGMPRSGTSLIEQIVAAHPQAYGAGELKVAESVLNGIRVGGVIIETTRQAGSKNPSENSALSLADRGQNYLEELEALAGKEALRITDKMPGNYMWVGLLGAILPQSRFIHCRRHPVDTCLSQFKLHFGAEVPYSYDLRDLGKAYRCYHELMQHWSTVIPPTQLLHLRYEDVVRDLDSTARKLVTFLDLPWSNACLKYWDVKRQVRTASAAQVRQPIYQHSVNRWRQYEKFLKPLLDELGDLVAAYEKE